MLKIKLQRVLEVHREYSIPSSLQDNLGDGYLIQNNPMFANVRRAASDFGFRFSAKRFAYYELHSLSHLPLILQKRIVPYHDNVSVLEWLEAKAPGSLAWSTAVAPVMNALVHESAHAIANTCLTRLWPPSAPTAVHRGYRQHAMRALMEESFANTMDFFVSYGARDICHTIFVSQSTFYYGDTVQVLTPLKCEIGLRATFKLIWLAFMHANFLFKELREDKLERCLQFVLDGDRGAISRRQHAKLRRLANAACRKAFELNIRFRLRTSRLYFKTQGISTPLLRLLDFDFMSRLEQQAALRDWLDLTCKVATQGVVPDMLRGGVRRAV